MLNRSLTMVGALYLASACLASLVFCSVGWAQFLTLGNRSYVSEDGTLGVVVVDTAARKGLFVLSNPTAQVAQEFSPLTKAAEARSLFITFDQQGRFAERLTLPSGKELSIRGSFRFSFGDGKSVGLDRNPWNTYITLVVGTSIISFSGVVPIANAAGDEVVGILEAVKPIPNQKTQAPVFSFSSSGDLLLNGKPYDGTTVGLGREFNHNCLQSGVALVPSEALKNLPSDGDQRKKRLEKLIAGAKRLSDYVLLMASDSSIVVFDPASNTFAVLEKAEDRSVCGVTTVEL